LVPRSRTARRGARHGIERLGRRAVERSPGLIPAPLAIVAAFEGLAAERTTGIEHLGRRGGTPRWVREA
jgi:hypothetical protein